MAEYRQHYEEIRTAGANLIAISVDPPKKSEAVRRDLGLPFAILCDTERRVVKQWDVYNAREKGGIAKPAVFIIGRDRAVRFSSVDGVASRVPASEVVRILHGVSGESSTRRKLYFPGPGDFFRAFRNFVRRVNRSSE